MFRVAVGCTTFAVNCGDNAVVSARTIDYDVDLASQIEMSFVPQGSTITTIDGNTYTTKLGVLGMGTNIFDRLVLFDGLNSGGLSVALLYQANLTFHRSATTNSEDTASSLSIFDLTMAVVSQFSTVTEVKEYLNTQSIVTQGDVKNPAALAKLKHILGPDWVEPDADGTLYLPIHFHFVDSKGNAVLLEANNEGGHSLYDTAAITNEPAWPQMMQAVEAYEALGPKDFAHIKELRGAQTVIPFNSEKQDNKFGWWGSISRLLRIRANLAGCDKFPWPECGVWSPGYSDAVPPGMPASSYKALKRAENYLQGVFVPMSQLVRIGDYGTQVKILRDHTLGFLTFYFQLGSDTAWRSVNVTQLHLDGVKRSFDANRPLRAAYSIDVTRNDGAGGRDASVLAGPKRMCFEHPTRRVSF